jgi:hypothetical protein
MIICLVDSNEPATRWNTLPSQAPPDMSTPKWEAGPACQNNKRRWNKNPNGQSIQVRKSAWCKTGNSPIICKIWQWLGKLLNHGHPNPLNQSAQSTDIPLTITKFEGGWKIYIKECLWEDIITHKNVKDYFAPTDEDSASLHFSPTCFQIKNPHSKQIVLLHIHFISFCLSPFPLFHFFFSLPLTRQDWLFFSLDDGDII